MVKTNSIPKICVTLPLAYSLFNPATKAPFGGWEFRLTLIARELAKRGNFDMNIIVGDFGQPHNEVIDGVKLTSWIGRNVWGVPARRLWNPFRRNSISFYSWDRIQKGLFNKLSKYLPNKTFGYIGKHHIPYKTISVYDEVDADIYIVPGNTIYSAEVAFFCLQRNKKYIFLAGSDFDYYPDYKLKPDGFDMYGTPHSLKFYSIETADAHIVQHEHQAELLFQGYGRTSTIVKNPIDIRRKFPRNSQANTILWVGKSDERVKRPSVVFELARRLPQYEFVMIMNIAFPIIHAEYLRQANKASNVRLIERVSLDEIEMFFANCRVHLNTSTFEGFPNTYLQAAKYGVPTIAMKVDPGYMLSQHKCGLIGGEDLGNLESNIHKLMTDDKLYANLGNKSIEYVRAYHDKDRVIPMYEEIFNLVLLKDKIKWSNLF